MKSSIDKLRWALAGGSLFLLLLLIAVVGYGRYRAAKLWKNRLNALGVHIDQTTDTITYSQTIEGRTVYILRAGKAVQHKDGKTILHNVQLTLFGKKDGSEDQIYGSEFEYDEKSGVARALGEVEMDLRAPGPLAKGSKAGLDGTKPENNVQAAGRDIHVKTSGLTYVRKLGVAATDQQVMFSYAGLQCTAKGAEFNSGEGIVHLLADVQLQGALHDKPLTLHAAKADLDHVSNSVMLQNPDLQSGGERASAANAVLHLRHDGSIETVDAEGGVVLQKLTRQIRTARMDGRFTSANTPEQTSLSGGVSLVDTNPARPMHGSANRLDGIFDAAGAPVKWTANGGVQLTTSVPSTSGQTLHRFLKGDQIVASLKSGQGKEKGELTELHVAGRAQASAVVPAPGGSKTTEIAADDLTAFFDGKENTGTPALERVVGVGHTHLQQDAPGGAQQTSTGNTLQLRFAPNDKQKGELQVASATQDGGVKFKSRPAANANGAQAAEPLSGSAEHSAYDGATENLTLTGNAQFTQGSTAIAANTLIVNQLTGDSDALGKVLATLTSQEGRTAAEATHIQAERAHLTRRTQVGEFYGSDAVPAKLWQGPSQVEAATITLDGKKHLLNARPDSQALSVHAVFASRQDSRPGESLATRETQIERVSASAMDYDDAARTATFSGNLRAQGTTGQVQADHAQMYFTPSGKRTSGAAAASVGSLGGAPLMGGSLQKAIVWGNVRLSQPGKTGRGDKLVYTANDSTFVLTGSPSHPPQIVVAEQGSVTGAALSFRSGDNTVVVSGSNPAATPNEHVRVHTETGAKQ